MAGAGESERVLMVGFNRRFAPLVTEAREMLLGVGEPMSMIATINAGAIPPDHWTQDLAVGGGRIIGEACHFIDLFRFVADSEIVAIDVAPMSNPQKPSLPRDTVTITLRFASGSIGTIHYLANGNAALPKEHYRFFCAGRVLELDNFRRLRGWGWSGFRTRRAMNQDKGQAHCVRAFVDAIAGRAPAPISRDEIVEVSRYSIQAQEAVA